MNPARDLIAGVLAEAHDNVVPLFPNSRPKATLDELAHSLRTLNREIERGERIVGFLVSAAGGELHPDLIGWLEGLAGTRLADMIADRRNALVTLREVREEERAQMRARLTGEK